MKQYHGIPDIERLRQWEELQIPFEYNDFLLPKILDDEEEKERRVKLYRGLDRDRNEDTLHGPFLDITVHSRDPLIRKVSDKRIRQACDIAQRLEVKAMILHTNLIPNFYDDVYRSGWLESNAEYFTRLLSGYPELCIYMENMFDEEPDSLVALAEMMDDPRFGICLDIAHCHISRTSIEAWHEACKPYIRHYHLNDNHGHKDEHLSLGEGTI
ncbi:MAG: TIM barrel protein, partial [Bacillota bacterium]|nr:TIM barrel protein [Bacillota bacterium]